MANPCYNTLEINGERDRIAAFKTAVSDTDCALSFAKILPIPPLFANLHCALSQVQKADGILSLTSSYRRTNDAGDICEERPLTPEELAQLDALDPDSSHRWVGTLWGCKWEPSDLELTEWDDTLHYQFETPWSPPTGIVETLRSRFPDLHITAFFNSPNELEAGYY